MDKVGKKEEESWLAAPKEEAVTSSQAALSALIRALYIFVIEAIIHALMHGMEKYINHAPYPTFVYRVIEWSGFGSLLSYVGIQFWKHHLAAYVETRLESRKMLNKLNEDDPPRNNTGL